MNEVIYGANHLALSKKDGGIRQWATDEAAWRKIAKYRLLLQDCLIFSLLGVGIRRGDKAAIHATRRWVTTIPEDSVLVKLDFTNVFNTLRRDSLLEAVTRDISKVYRFAHAAYSNRPLLLYMARTTYALRRETARQPLGPSGVQPRATAAFNKAEIGPTHRLLG